MVENEKKSPLPAKPGRGATTERQPGRSTIYNDDTLMHCDTDENAGIAADEMSKMPMQLEREHLH